jgi:hypothetical protein
MREVLLAFGRGLVKILIGSLVGTGACLLTLGIVSRDKPRVSDTSPEFYLAIGVGLLTAGALLAVMFLFSRHRTPEVDRREQAPPAAKWPRADEERGGTERP